MPKFTNLIDDVEKLAFEVLMWIIFIPKTLTKVFINPSWVSTYVKDELEKERGNRFQAYLSPVFLLIVSSVIPVAITLIIPETSVEIVGPDEGFVGQEYYFAPGKLVARWPSRQPIEYRYEVWEWEQEQEQWMPRWESEEWSSKNRLAYIWQEPGEYSVDFYIRNGMGEEVFNYNCILIYENEDQFFNLAGSYDGKTCDDASIGSETRSQKEPPQSTFQRLEKELKGERVFIAGLIFLAFPLLFSLIIELFQKTPLNRENLQEMFYIQCLYFSPLYFGLSAIILSAPFVIDSAESEPSNLSKNLFAVSALWFLLIFGWFLYNEVREIIAEFTSNGYRRRRGVGVFLLCLTVPVFVGFIGLLLVDEADASKLLVWRMYNWGFGLLLLVGAYRFVRWNIFRRGAEEAEKPEIQEPTTA